MNKNSSESNVSSRLRKYILETATVSVTMILLGVVKEFFPLILEKVIPELSKRSLLGLAALATIVALFELVCILYLLRQAKLTPRFGVYWDKKLNPYCPACKTPLAMSKVSSMLLCFRCKEQVGIVSGTPITLEEARKRMA